MPASLKIKHEESHRDNAYKENPDICGGWFGNVRAGTRAGFDHQAKIRSEYKALVFKFAHRQSRIECYVEKRW